MIRDLFLADVVSEFVGSFGQLLAKVIAYPPKAALDNLITSLRQKVEEDFNITLASYEEVDRYEAFNYLIPYGLRAANVMLIVAAILGGDASDAQMDLGSVYSYWEATSHQKYELGGPHQHPDLDNLALQAFNWKQFSQNVSVSAWSGLFGGIEFTQRGPLTSKTTGGYHRFLIMNLLGCIDRFCEDYPFCQLPPECYVNEMHEDDLETILTVITESHHNLSLI